MELVRSQLTVLVLTSSHEEILPISAVPDCNEFDTSDALKGWAADEFTVPTFEGDRVVNSGFGILQRFGKLVSSLWIRIVKIAINFSAAIFSQSEPKGNIPEKSNSVGEEHVCIATQPA